MQSAKPYSVRDGIHEFNTKNDKPNDCTLSSVSYVLGTLYSVMNYPKISMKLIYKSLVLQSLVRHVSR
jgi:hypothetical protein